MLWRASTLDVVAMVLLAAKLLDHLRYVFAPSRWPLLRSVATTWVADQYVRLRHPGWYQQILTERPAAAARGHESDGVPSSAAGREATAERAGS